MKGEHIPKTSRELYSETKNITYLKNSKRIVQRGGICSGWNDKVFMKLSLKSLILIISHFNLQFYE